MVAYFKLCNDRTVYNSTVNYDARDKCAPRDDTRTVTDWRKLIS